MITATKTQLKQLLLVVLPLVAGALLYAGFRSEKPLFLWWMNDGAARLSWKAAEWLPDYLWCFSLLALVSLIWNGWKNIPRYWLLALWALITLTELFQYKGWMFGTGDWKDVLSYQLAFFTHIVINRKPLL